MLLGAALCAAGVARPLLQHYVFYISPIFVELPLEPGARGGAVGWGTALQAGRSRVRFPMVSLT